jgi:hypothetical protein
MKKCCFIKIIRKYESDNFSYKIIKNEEAYESFSELFNSLNEFCKIEIVSFEDCDYDTSLFISFDVVDVTPLFKEFMHPFLKEKKFKKVFFDFATYDNQEISENDFDEIEKLTDRESYFISKNLLTNRDNHLYFEVLFYHHIREDKEIPRNILAYKRIKESQRFFWPKYKGFYFPGHIRFHKVKFLEFLYQNKFLEEIIWSCTGIDFDKPIFRDFVSDEQDSEFFSFEVLKLLPKRIDFDLFNKDVYNSRGGQINLVTYLDTTFEIVPETRFYDTNGNKGSKKTYSTWNNISEKTIKPTMLSHPFILISKPNTISLLENWGLKYKFDFWNFEYDSILDHNERMSAIQQFTKKVMQMSIKELKEFHNDYNQFTQSNYNTMLNDMYIKSVRQIHEKI